MKEANNKKALVVTTVASTIDQFCMGDIKILQQYYDITVAANFSIGNNTSSARVIEFKSELEYAGIQVIEINSTRKPFSKCNFIAYKELKKVIDKGHFNLIHCHTPVAAMLVRLAALEARKYGTKVIYTAHGFHFFKGASMKNWLIYYPIERILAHFTDLLITINHEDYNRAKNFKAQKVAYIPGVGVDTKKFATPTVNKKEKRQEICVYEDAVVLLSVGELNKNKNHETVIRAVRKLNNPKVCYVICGKGDLEGHLRELVASLSMEQQVKLLGFRTDVSEIYQVADMFVFPSFREGLSVSLMEAMAAGLPVVCSDIRGNSDLIENGKGGYLVKPDDVEGFAEAIEKVICESISMGLLNMQIINHYDLISVKESMKSLYGSAIQ